MRYVCHHVFLFARHATELWSPATVHGLLLIYLPWRDGRLSWLTHREQFSQLNAIYVYSLPIFLTPFCACRPTELWRRGPILRSTVSSTTRLSSVVRQPRTRVESRDIWLTNVRLHRESTALPVCCKVHAQKKTIALHLRCSCLWFSAPLGVAEWVYPRFWPWA